MKKRATLLGPDGQPVRRRAHASTSFSSGFDGASTGRRARNWKPPSSTINSLLLSSLEHLRNRARDQARNVPWMKRADRSYVANVVGNGIRPIPMTKDEAFNEAAQEAWEEFVFNSDADGKLDFYGQQALVTRSIYQSGEVLARLVEQPSDEVDLLIPMQIKVLESDHLDHTHTFDMPEGGRIIQGVEFNGLDKISAYHLWRQHPNELLGMRNAEMRVRVDADEVLHIFEPTRPGQVRGYPAMSATLLRMMDLMEYEDAEIVRKKFAAFLTFFIKSTADSERDLLDEELSDALDGVDGSGGHDSGPSLAELEPGTGQYLDPGQEIQITEPADVGSGYEPFVRMNLRAIAAGADVTYEQMTGDLTGVNFSSIRSGLNEMQRIWEQFQNQILVHQFCQPVYRAFIRHAVMNGVLDAQDFALMPHKYFKVKWLAPGWPYVNPQQEAQADLLSIRSGTTSRTRVAARRGNDVRELDREIEKDNKRADQNNFVFDSDPRKTNKSGALHGSTAIFEKDAEDDFAPDPDEDPEAEESERSIIVTE